MKLTELEQREIRDKNIIIFGVKEGSTKQDTIERVQNINTDCHLLAKIEKQNLFRLGKVENVKSNEQGKKPLGPLKLCTVSKEQKWNILKRINALKLNGIFAKPDLNIKEREVDFRLRAELKKIRAANPTQIYKIFRERIQKIDQ